MSAMEGVQLTVQAAEKRDAGRGIARLPESARRNLSVLSGDTVLVEGVQTAVAKVWPGGPDTSEGSMLIDADTRSNAGVQVGDTVRVTATSVEDANRVTLVAPQSLKTADVSEDAVIQALAEDLQDRPLRAGESVHIERLGGLEFQVATSDPRGTIRVTAGTDIDLNYDSDAPARANGSSTSTSTSGSTAAGQSTGAATNDDSPAAGTSSDTAALQTNYEDIGGLDDELEMVREMIELPLSRPEVFHRLGVEPPKGVLLYGPPGTGKTLIARAVANEVNAQFITVDGPEIMSKYKGESEEQLREVFDQAQEESPTVVFFDEIDSIAGKRDEEADVENRVVGQLLSLMDGLDARGNVIVIGATNRVDAIDPALRRGGRFDREIEIGVPGAAGRREILEVHTRRMPLADEIDLDQLADRTYGFVGADIETLGQEAAMTALRRAREGGDTDLSSVEVARRDFETAMSSIEPSAMREYVAETPSTDFSEVGGLESAQESSSGRLRGRSRMTRCSRRPRPTHQRGYSCTGLQGPARHCWPAPSPVRVK
ncbi:MAG: ATP-dependent 26S proteasome regulatory subunit [Halorubrum sp. J07HR59]|nr:MAG: ATP-dependent 26S proteasome regulatory subunit [Halorubrum sp. J07HR59]